MKAKARRRSSSKSKKSIARKKTTRVTVDFPDNEHRRLKALASLEGVTLQEYIRSRVMNTVNADIPEAQFKKLVEQILDDHADALRRLADR